MNVRIATPDDIRAYAGRELPHEWSIARTVGHAAERDGEVVALGIVTWDRYGRAWGWYDARERLGATTMHRRAKAMLALLREVGEPALHAICNPEIPGADKWLVRLGFTRAPELDPGSKYPVWKCDLSP